MIGRFPGHQGGARRRPAVCLLSGAVVAMYREVELASDVEFLHSVRQIEKRDPGEIEEDVASSPRGLTRAESEQRGRVAEEKFGEVPTCAARAARAPGALRTTKEGRGGVQGAL